MAKHYLIETYGCQMNERDTEILAGLLEKTGYQPTTDEQQADILLLNTCCVRETAENKIWGRIGELTHLKHRKPEMLLGICGCMTQQSDVAEKIRQKAPHIDLILGTHNVHTLPELIRETEETRKPVLQVWDSEGEIMEDLPTSREGGLKAFVNIMYGCNNYCTYCIVPYVRGRERSRKPDNVVQEVQKLVEEGYKDITLLGQNVNSYGKDLEPKEDFAGLLERLNKVNADYRLRFTTSHPKDLGERLIRVMAAGGRVCEHIHLPVQAGSNKVLKAMNRRYTREQYLDLVHRLREAVPNIAITTDLIVGFPGETEEDFQETMDLLNQVHFDSAFTFVYNKRSGTPAATMENQVSDEDKKSRIQQLISLQNQITLEENEKLVGKVFEVLVEEVNRNDASKLTGRTRSFKTVVLPGSSELIGQFVQVKIEVAKTWHIEGKLI